MCFRFVHLSVEYSIRAPMCLETSRLEVEVLETMADFHLQVLETIKDFRLPVLETIEDFHLQGEVSALSVKVQNLKNQ